MPFNPNLPVHGSPISSGELRNQFNGLKQLIDNLPSGPAGPPGEQGMQGPPGPPGEVTLQEFETAINGTALNPAGQITQLDTVVSNPPTQHQITEIVDKINELITVLSRQV